jgi:hypothetical protein
MLGVTAAVTVKVKATVRDVMFAPLIVKVAV